MDTPKEENLIGANKTVEEIRKEIGADSLYYLSLEGLERSIDKGKEFCTGCFDGNYALEKEKGE